MKEDKKHTPLPYALRAAGDKTLEWHLYQDDLWIATIKNYTEAITILRARNSHYIQKEALDNFPDIHDGRMSNDELMEACRDWYAEYCQPAIVKAEGK